MNPTGLSSGTLSGCLQRLREGLWLLSKDTDSGHNVIVVRHGKGGKDQRTMLPAACGGCWTAWAEA